MILKVENILTTGEPFPRSAQFLFHTFTTVTYLQIDIVVDCCRCHFEIAQATLQRGNSTSRRAVGGRCNSDLDKKTNHEHENSIKLSTEEGNGKGWCKCKAMTGEKKQKSSLFMTKLVRFDLNCE